MTLILQAALLVHLTLVVPTLVNSADDVHFVVETANDEKKHDMGEDYGHMTQNDYTNNENNDRYNDYSTDKEKNNKDNEKKNTYNEKNNKDNKKNNTENVAAVVAANEKFSRAIYSHLGKREDNLIISPSSISTVLTMLAVGARGKALKQLTDGLSLPMQGTLHKRANLLIFSYLRRMVSTNTNICFAGNTSRVQNPFAYSCLEQRFHP